MDRYTILNTTAQALYGDILHCREIATGQEVAIKRMNLKAARAQRTSSFQTEVLEDAFYERSVNRAMSRKRHPNIVACRHDFEHEGAIHLVMDFCKNGDLFERVNKAATITGRSVTVFEARRYFNQITAGLSSLHSNGFAHLDLSLENVLLDARDCVKLCDFGLASPAHVRQTKLVGKAFYVAPEVIAGEGSYDPIAADLWGLGVMLFILLTGIPPFQMAHTRDDRFAFVRRYGLVKLLDQWQLLKVLPIEMIQLLTSLLAIEPTQRLSLRQVMAHPALVLSPTQKKISETTRPAPPIMRKHRGWLSTFLHMNAPSRRRIIK